MSKVKVVFLHIKVEKRQFSYEALMIKMDRYIAKMNHLFHFLLVWIKKRIIFVFAVALQLLQLTHICPDSFTAPVTSLVCRLQNSTLYFLLKNMPKCVTLAIQGPEGHKRVKISETSMASDLYTAVKQAYEFSDETGFFLTQDKQRSLVIDNSKLCEVSKYDLKHGDRLFLHHTITPHESSSFGQALNFLGSSIENKDGPSIASDTSSRAINVSSNNAISTSSHSTQPHQIKTAQADKIALNQQVNDVQSKSAI